MATYTIIGGDQKEYGPVTADEVRQWIAESRLNEKSLVKAESDAGFRALEKFPEFADAFAPKAPAPGSPPAFAGSAGGSAISDRDDELDMGGCISRGWELVKNNMGLLFVGTLVYMLIECAIGGLAQIPVIGALFSIANFMISGPLMGGVFYLFHPRHPQASRRKSATFFPVSGARSRSCFSERWFKACSSAVVLAPVHHHVCNKIPSARPSPATFATGHSAGP